MGYPITDKKSIFDISQFGMPNDLLNLKLMINLAQERGVGFEPT